MFSEAGRQTCRRESQGLIIAYCFAQRVQRAFMLCVRFALRMCTPPRVASAAILLSQRSFDQHTWLSLIQVRRRSIVRRSERSCALTSPPPSHITFSNHLQAHTPGVSLGMGAGSGPSARALNSGICVIAPSRICVGVVPRRQDSEPAPPEKASDSNFGPCSVTFVGQSPVGSLGAQTCANPVRSAELSPDMVGINGRAHLQLLSKSQIRSKPPEFHPSDTRPGQSQGNTYADI